MANDVPWPGGVKRVRMLAHIYGIELPEEMPVEPLREWPWPDTPRMTYDPLSDPLNDPFPEELR